MWELTKSFRFKADHTLSGRHFGAASEEIHGHSFRSEVSLRAMPDPVTGMLVDFGLLQRAIEDVRRRSTTNPQQDRGDWRVDAGEPFAFHPGADAAYQGTDPLQNPSRQLQ
jgi:6-pyruvoyl tetrahydropterin synthase